jgi:glycerol-3-phosphate dehydrogenase
VLFAVPWHNKIIIGTTDTPIDSPNEASLAEPVALDEEIDFILHQIGRYLTHTPTRKNIRSVFAGLRPLVKRNAGNTAELSRDHLIAVSSSGLITITGGKWTTYRLMAEDVINTALRQGNLEERPCRTAALPIHGAKEDIDFKKSFYYYGSDEEKIRLLIQKDPSLGEPVHADLPYVKAEIVLGVQNEMCMTVEDALARRTRALLLDARAAMHCAPAVARLMAIELNHDGDWADKQVASFLETARNYLPALNR